MADGTNNDGDFSKQHKIENDKEEAGKPKVAIEHFDNNQEAAKKKLNELPSEIDDDRKNHDIQVEETGQKMYEGMNESEMEDDVQKHLNHFWIDHHLYLLQSSSDDGSDLDLGNSENDEDLNIKKQSDQENQGTIANAEFTDQDRNDKVEDEIPEENSKLRSIVETLDQQISQFKRLARGHKKLCNDDDSDDEEVLRKILGLKGDSKLEHLDNKSKDTDQFNDVTHPDFYTNIEGLEEQMYELMREFKEDEEKEKQGRLNKLNVKQKVSNQPEDGIDCVDFTEIHGLEFDKSKEEFKGKEEDVTKGELDRKQKKALDQVYEALELILGELDTEIPRLQVHLARLRQQVVEIFQQLEFEFEKAEAEEFRYGNGGTS
ncbi:unnamed protein product [Ilex paraguariensis]|uniref:Uncharacterized protein n=1 Tax=Ilex paraguariensis TaxID=185542 RepID=A0ABC8URF9_9AQUA